MSDVFICPNCQTKNNKSALFCNHCSQKIHLKLNSVWHMIFDFFANLIDYDSKLFSSARGLFIPGYLTNQYLLKRRVSYLTPIRLFIITMLMFFWLLSMQGYDRTIFKAGAGDGLELSAGETGALNETNNGRFYSLLENIYNDLKFETLFKRFNAAIDLQKESLGKKLKKYENKLKKYKGDKKRYDKYLVRHKKVKEDLIKLEHNKTVTKEMHESFEINADDTINIQLFRNSYDFKTTDISYLSSQELIEKYKIDNWLEKIFVEKLLKFNQDSKEFGKFVFQNLTWMVLIEILIMCVFFKAFYIRSKRKYVEHFIYHLNVRSWLFIIGSIVFVIPSSFYNEWIILVVVFAIVVYLNMSMKKVYKQSYFVTIVKFSILSFIELFVLLISFLIVLTISSLFF